jgi:uncharacterized protein DUF5666
MNHIRAFILGFFFLLSAGGAALLPACSASSAYALQAQGAAPPSAVTRRIGSIKAIDGNVITLTPDSGPEVAVAVEAATRIVRIPPGEKNLQNATPIQLQDLQVGDRILAGGKASEDGKSIAAASVVVMKRSDVESRQEQERQDWQKRGLGGTVSSVDNATGTITISSAGFAGNKAIAVHTSKSTIFRRYSPDSVKFEEAKPSTLQEVQPGDQVRARGNRSPDGAEFAAEEIVTGSFRNIAGLVNSVDANAGTVIVQDLLTKKAVLVKITADSQLHKLPPEMAQHIAMRLKAKAAMPGAGGNPSAGSGAGNGQGTAAGVSPTGMAAPGAGGPGAGGGMRAGGAPDFQQMLSRMPAVTLADLHKGDAVMMVATRGAAPSPSTAITLLSGVELILEAAPNGSQAMMLAPWSLGGAPNGDTNP